MAGHSTYTPKTASRSGSRARLPILGLVHDSVRRLSDAAQPELLWTFGGILTFMLVAQIVTGVVLAMHYTPDGQLAFNSVENDHARRELRLAAALSALQRRVALLLRRLHPHLPRPLLRLLQGAARDAVDPRRHHLPPDDGDGLHGLRAALGADELLGGDRHHQPLHGDPAGRRLRSRPGCAAASRSTTRRSTASSRCTICCRS